MSVQNLAAIANVLMQLNGVLPEAKEVVKHVIGLIRREQPMLTVAQAAALLRTTSAENLAELEDWFASHPGA